MKSISEARNELQNGKIIIYPTDTVWGMGCDPFNQKAINELFRIKGKKKEGLSVMFDNIEKIYETKILHMWHDEKKLLLFKNYYSHYLLLFTLLVNAVYY